MPGVENASAKGTVDVSVFPETDDRCVCFALWVSLCESHSAGTDLSQGVRRWIKCKRKCCTPRGNCRVRIVMFCLSKIAMCQVPHSDRVLGFLGREERLNPSLNPKIAPDPKTTYGAPWSDRPGQRLQAVCWVETLISLSV